MGLSSLFEHAASLSPEGRNALLGLAILVGFLTMVALLPDFDGTDDSDWDVHGGDDLWKH